MKIYLLSILCFACTSVLFSQHTERIRVKSGIDQWENLMKAVYLYPTFKEGMVELRNGQKYMRPMNYNRIAATVEFITEKNDTMAFADESAIGHINIGGDIFIFIPACMRLLSSKKVKLYVYEKMKIGDTQKIGAMGIPNSASAIESVDKLMTHQRIYNIDVNETVILSKTTTYYVQTATSEIIQANKKNLLHLFSKNEAAVKEYLGSNNVSFNKEDDLITLVKFLDKL